MTSRSRRRDPIAAPLIWLPLVLGIAVATSACGDGYPKEDLDLDNPSSGISSAAVVNSLNRMNETSLTATRWTITLIDPCELRLLARRPDGKKESLGLQLLHSDMQVKGNIGGPIHAVQVEFSGTAELTDEHLFEADRWTDAVEYATKLQTLQRICAKRP